MEHIIVMVALAILGIGVIAAIAGLIEFTRCFENSAQDPQKRAASAEPRSSTGPSA